MKTALIVIGILVLVSVLIGWIMEPWYDEFDDDDRL